MPTHMPQGARPKNVNMMCSSNANTTAKLKALENADKKTLAPVITKDKEGRRVLRMVSLGKRDAMQGIDGSADLSDETGLSGFGDGKVSRFLKRRCNELQKLWHFGEMLLYMGFLVSFHTLLFNTRTESEYYLAQHIKNTFVYNCFDGDHNRMMDVRRIPDFWEWSENVLIPGLFSNSATGEFWPDGSGHFSNTDATPYSTDELVDQSNYMNLGLGVQFRQVRAAPQMNSHTSAGVLPGVPIFPRYTDLDSPTDTGLFGLHTAGSHNASFHHFSAEEIGSEPLYSSSSVSEATYPGDGYVAFIMPFYSPEKLPFERGNATQVTDFKKYTYLNPKNFSCYRTSVNGVDINQACDSNPNTGMAKGAAEQLITDLKEKHWIDFQTRFVGIKLQYWNPNAGLMAKVDLMFEFPAAGGVLPSFSVQTSRVDEEAIDNCYFNLVIVYVYVAIYMVLEVGGIYLERGDYFRDVWNILDWLNIIMFFFSADYLMRGLIDPDPLPNTLMSETIGFQDATLTFNAYMNAKKLLGFNATLQVLKLNKYFNERFPKMSLLSQVLSQAVFDLLFFTVTFMISMFAFADCFYVMLGSTMEGYYNLSRSVLSLFRALFGDFDVDEIDDNSSEPMNSIIFLGFLFVTVFMVLSMFFAILGDAQGTVLARNAYLEEKKMKDHPHKHLSWVGRLKAKLAIYSHQHFPSFIDRPEWAYLTPEEETKIQLKQQIVQQQTLRVWGKKGPDWITASHKMESLLRVLKTVESDETSLESATAPELNQASKQSGQMLFDPLEEDDQLEDKTSKAVCCLLEEEQSIEMSKVSETEKASQADMLASSSPVLAAEAATAAADLCPCPSNEVEKHQETPEGAHKGVTLGPPTKSAHKADDEALDSKSMSEVTSEVIKHDALSITNQGQIANVGMSRKERLSQIAEIVLRTDVQMVLYLVFLVLFHSILFQCRDFNEYYLSNNLKSIFISNAFDADHNELMDIRRISDIWEWNDAAFIPGLFSNSPGGENWADGTGPFSQEGATTYGAMDLASQAHVMGLMGGIQLRQVRQKPSPLGRDLFGVKQYRPIIKGYDVEGTELDKTPYGAAGHVFKYWSGDELGGPAAYSPSIVSTNTYVAGGYAAYILPFFSNVSLPHETGNSTHPVIDFRDYADSVEPKRFYCVRTSTNGVDIKQGCDTDPSTNVVRNMADQLMRDLKEGHWIDPQTRMIEIKVQLTSANSGLEAHMGLMFEFPAAGGVLPSFMIHTRRLEPQPSLSIEVYILATYAAVFIMLELLQLWKQGYKVYLVQIWNYMDWANLIIFFISAENLRKGFLDIAPIPPCTISETVGFSNDYQSMQYFVAAKQLLAFNAMLQVLKLSKFCNVLVPRMSMLAKVLSMASLDLMFFGVTFSVSLVAFADCFYVNLGSNIDTYYSFDRSIISLLRSLFGDFDIDEIDDNSSSQLNSYVFLAYLFAAVFILLSMVFTILGEAQSNVIEQQKEIARKQRGKKKYTWREQLKAKWQLLQGVVIRNFSSKVIPTKLSMNQSMLLDGLKSQIATDLKKDDKKARKQAEEQAYSLVFKLVQKAATSKWLQKTRTNRQNTEPPPLAVEALTKANNELHQDRHGGSQVDIILRMLQQKHRISVADAQALRQACSRNVGTEAII